MLCQLPKCHSVGVSVPEPSHLRVTCAAAQTRHHSPQGPSLVPSAFSEVAPNVSTLHGLRRTILSKSRGSLGLGVVRRERGLTGKGFLSAAIWFNTQILIAFLFYRYCESDVYGGV